MAEQHGPVRTCIGCRERASRDELARYVARPSDGAVVHVERDARGCAPGRGAWLHADATCLERALRRQAFRRAFRIAGAARIELAGQVAPDGAEDDGAGHVGRPD